jgi:hypothetical protein
VRTAPYFTANGCNVAIFGRPSDSEDFDYADRISDTHQPDCQLDQYPNELRSIRNT